MGIVTCGGCGLKFNRSQEDAEFIKGKWYHFQCAKTKNAKIELDAYVCKIFSLKAPGPVNNALLKKYRENYGYTYDGMMKALKFFYEVRKHSSEQAEEKVGIIPYVYQDAQDYYDSIEKRQNKITSSAIKINPNEIKISFIKPETKEVESNIDELNSLFGEE